MDSPFDAKTVAELRRPLDPDSISTLRDGPASGTHYLEAVIVEYAANRIFGPGNWAFRVVGQPWRESEETKSGSPQTVWCALGELEVRGGLLFRDLGSNQQSGPGAPAMEMSIKGAVTDAMKRCLRHYGDQFGLVLYDKAVSMGQIAKEYAEANHTKRAPAAMLEATADAIEQSGQLPKEIRELATAIDESERRRGTPEEEWKKLLTLMPKVRVTGPMIAPAIGGVFARPYFEEWLAGNESRTAQGLIDSVAGVGA